MFSSANIHLASNTSSVNIHLATIAPRALLEVDNSEFVCTYTAHCISDCFCCSFFACDCLMTCPEGEVS